MDVDPYSNKSRLIPVREFMRLVEDHPQFPASVDAQKFYRWMQQGIDGVRLATVKIGGRRFTSWAAYESFVAALSTPRENPTPAEHPRRHEKLREKEKADARAYLAQELGRGGPAPCTR